MQIDVAANEGTETKGKEGNRRKAGFETINYKLTTNYFDFFKNALAEC